MEFKGSRTEANLMAAFAGESQARNKYTFYASQARKDGYMQIARIFEETAANEKEHAELWFKQLHGGSMPGTADNLADAAAGEHYEWTQMYADFAKVAREEGFTAIATTFELVGKIESFHEQRYLKLRDKMCIRDSRYTYEIEASPAARKAWWRRPIVALAASLFLVVAVSLTLLYRCV